MPLYNWKCHGCNSEHEETQTIEEGEAYKHAVQVCPQCGEEHFQTRLLSKTSFSLQGRGWFKTGGY